MASKDRSEEKAATERDTLRALVEQLIEAGQDMRPYLNDLCYAKAEAMAWDAALIAAEQRIAELEATHEKL